MPAEIDSVPLYHLSPKRLSHSPKVFSDGTSVDWPLEKRVLPHSLSLNGKRTACINLSRLIKVDDPSPFPALTQIEVYGRVATRGRA